MLHLAAVLRLDLLGELLLAVVIGGLIGLEREARGKPAGLRTNVLICLGATLITDVSLALGGGERADSARLAAQVVSGIGFLGAGTIMQARGTVLGLTSAATLWVVAAIGIAIGARQTVEAVGAAVLVLLILVPLAKLEGMLTELRRERTMSLELSRVGQSADEVAEVLEECGLSVRGRHEALRDDRLLLRVHLVGSSEAWKAAHVAMKERSDVHAMRVS
jgi:putative Mg2+ transporter-C (MgtC) family protein